MSKMNSEYWKAYRKKNKERISEQRKAKRKLNPEKYREQCRKYYNTNKKKFFAKRIDKVHRDVGFRIRINLARRINHSVKKGLKSRKTLELLGCSIEELKIHLQSQFKEGMSWDNYGYRGWHIDHIRPCASFNLEDPEEQKLCFNYKNLQPLWSQENFLKSDKFSF